MILHMAALWENVVVEDMIFLFAQDTQTFCSNFGYHMERSITPDEAEAILIGKDYLDFKSFGHIIKISKEYLKPELNPFKQIPTEFRNSIDELFIVRNHIAHMSRKSRRSYRKMTSKSEYGLGSIDVGQFLLSVPEHGDKAVVFDSAGRKRIFELYIEALEHVSASIVAYLSDII